LSHPTEDKKTIMVCDDEPDLLQLFGMALKSTYNVILVSSGEDCIDKFVEVKTQGNKVHIILLDYRLGDMLGDSVAKKIKAYNRTKIILISSYDLTNVVVKELEENKYIIKYIKKPIQVADLIEIVASTIC
jgi:response regulator RpfG family c-di-GMP phosphodiesterase